MDYYLVPPPVSADKIAGKYLLSQESGEIIKSYTLEQKLPDFIDYHSAGDILKEGYQLLIKDNKIEIRASHDAGKFYAMKTLQQLSRHIDTDGFLANIVIEDNPVFKNRAVMLDISRNKVPKMETMYRLVDLWAELKLNQVQLYTEHTFAYKDHEKVWKDASPFTTEEILKLDKYCKVRAIELIPNQNSFGHMERWLKFDEYRDLAESPEGFTDPSGIFFDTPSTLDPNSPEVILFLNTLYDELLPNFSSSTLNIGCDETYDLCQGKSKKYCEEYGSGKVYLDFIKKLALEVSARNMRMQFYGDIIVKYPELIPELPKDIIALDWGYEADHPFEKETAAFAEAGLEFYVCAGTSAWNSTAGRWNNARENIRSAAYYGEKNGASGFMITEWGDNGHWQQHPVPIPGYMAGASAAWSGHHGTEIDFEKNLSIHYFKDSTGRAAKALFIMANLYEKYSKGVHNSSIFALTMMEASYSGYRNYFPALRGTPFSEALSVIPEVKKLIREADFGSDDGSIIREELAFTADILEFGINLTIKFFETEDLRVEDISDTERKVLSMELITLIPEFERLWLVRNRPGGLKSSAGLLNKLDEDYLNK